MSRPADIRAHILECLPEIEWVSDEATREKIVDAFQMALERSTWERLEDVPHVFAGKTPMGDMLGHVRQVVQLCRESVRILNSFEHEIDEQVVLVGALLHDVGKIVEYGLREGVAVRNMRLRHPMLGAHMALACGLPDDIVHIIMRHSAEGEIPLPPGHETGGGLANRRTIEGMVVANCDYLQAEARKRKWRAADGTDPPLDPGVPFNG
ncbi:HD domain-containing protein [Nitrospinota bacterium]